MAAKFNICFTFILFEILINSQPGFSLTGFAHYQLLNRDESSAAVNALRQSPDLFQKVHFHRSKRDSFTNTSEQSRQHALDSSFDLAEAIQKVSFNLTAFDRQFNIRILNAGSVVNQNLLTPGFQVFTISGTGQRHEAKNLALDRFFSGVLDNVDDPSIGQDSEVFGYIDHHGNAMLTIKTREESFSVEPLSRFQGDRISFDQHPQYIIYRSSDLRMPNDTHFCGAATYKHSDSPPLPFHEELLKHTRLKRDIKPKIISKKGDTSKLSANPNSSRLLVDDDADFETQEVRAYATGYDDASMDRDSCELCLVADYMFYQNVAHSDETAATSYMIYLVSQVNNIYRKEGFGRQTGDGQLRNFGFTIRRIEVHQEPTPSTENPSRRHYNAKQEVWDQGVLLESFSRTGNHAGCCLSHLFTHRPFEGGVLGLAYLANADTYKVGGICSSAGSFFVNTGWSSTMFADGSLVPSQQAVLVLAHELGHNWGSPHDLDNKDCAPSSTFGGKYIMWMYSVPGYEPNNWHFSPCSLSAIGEVIKNKANSCFRRRPRAYCGNGFVEGSEQCDGGPAGLRNEDNCCNADCTFKAPAICSDVNQECCRDCRPAPADTMCWREGELSQSSTCLGKAYCNGTVAECQPRELLTGKPCFDNGQCRNGTCLPFCEVHGLKTCMCDQLESACQYCCFTANGTCAPLELAPDFKPKFLANGRPCPYGVCDRGFCKKTMMNTVEKFWTYLTEIEVHNLAKFMRDNIVGVTIIIALIVWIPLSCTIWCLDRRQERLLEKAYTKRERYNGELVERRSKVYYLPRSGATTVKSQPDNQFFPAGPGFARLKLGSRSQNYDPTSPSQPVQLTPQGYYEQKAAVAALAEATTPYGSGFQPVPYNRVFSLSPSQLRDNDGGNVRQLRYIKNPNFLAP